MPIGVGDTIEGRYRLLGELGEGGMGKVFLAEHVLIQRKLAVKILHARYAGDQNVVERFMNEARAAGTLGHPNIVESTDMGFTREDVPYIAFEYLQGTSLTDEIYRLKGLPVRRALRIAYQIASALEAAHNAGIVHRDLKSDNIFLTDREDVADHVKVLDFGVSRFLESKNDTSSPNQMMGTPEYMSPEQVTAPERVDVRADIYGLGVILYEMLAGRCPFRADKDPHAVLHQVIHAPPPPIGVPLPPGLPEMIFSKLLAKNPDERYRSMKEVAGAIEAFHLIIRPPHSRTPLSVPIVPAPIAPVGPDTDPIALVALPVAAPRRPSLSWLAAGVLSIGAGAGWLVVDHARVATKPTTAQVEAIDRDAKSLGTALANTLAAAKGRVASIAGSSMLRAAIETDVDTLRDVVKTEVSFNPKPGESLEIFQGEASIARFPATAKPTPATPSPIDVDGAGLVVVVREPIRTKDNVAGSAVLASSFDLAPHRDELASHVVTAQLVGLRDPVNLVLGTPGTAVVESLVPLPSELEAPSLTIHSTLQLPEPPGIAVRHIALLGIGGLLVLSFLGRLLLMRSRG